MSEVWHRIDYVRYASMLDEFDNPLGNGSLELVHRTYTVLKHTKKGAWLNIGFGRRFVLCASKRQFASPTLSLAKLKFRKRKERQLGILRAKIRDIEEALGKLDTFKPK